MFKICRFKGNQMNVRNGRNLSFDSFNSLADHFSVCKKGNKHESYFVRGELDPIYRKDDNLKQTRIFVIDGDASTDNPQSAPDPVELHKILKDLAINHFIYTTHSHNPPEKNKFRCVVETEPHTKGEIKDLARQIMGSLSGYPLVHVKEMNTWSQPWFYPTRDDPDDGKFLFLKYTDGSPAVIQHYVKQVDTQTPQYQEGVIPVDEMIELIQSGKTYHQPLLNLSYQYAKDGMNKTLAINTLQAIMNGCKVKDERWQERYDSIPHLVEGAVLKVKTFDIPAYNPDEEVLPEPIISQGISPIVHPPGLLGDLVTGAFNQQFVPSNIFALASALGLVAGITGRTFNVSGTGLNIEMLVIARTGRGKDSIRKFISQTLLSLNEHGDVSSFLAPARFTGPVAMYNALKDSRSCVSVQTECGLIKSSEAGDSSGIIRYQLGLYSASGKNEMMGAEGYSSKDGSIQPLRAAAMTFIMESTAESFSSIFTDEKALLSGELPRVGIYRETDFIPEFVLGDKPPLPNDVMLKLKYLTQLCARQQARVTPDVIDLQVEDKERLKKISDKWRDTLNSGAEDIRTLMATRNTLRTLKYAGIAAAFNNDPGDSVIHNRELDWADRAIEAEFESIDTFFRRVEIKGDIYDTAKRLKFSIIKALQGKETASRAVNGFFRKQGIMTLGNFNAICANVKAVRELNDRKGGNKSGAQKVLDFFIANGYCTKPYTLTNPETMNTTKVIKFLREFNDL